MQAKVRDWVLDRSTLGPEPYERFNKALPRGVGWLNTLGSTALVLIAVEIITGMFLALYYSPHPDASYESIQFIDHQLWGGRWVHGIHAYAASALIVVVGLHLLRTYLQGAYKAPRELIWLIGVVMLVLVLGFGFTGELLRWDKNAYFATEVRTRYAGEMPVLGPVIQHLIRGGPDIGAMTITRFYALHMLFLPALLLPLIGLHLLLVWRKGPTPPGARVGEAPPPAGRFLEDQLWKSSVVMFAAIGLVVLLALIKPAGLEFKADPADASYNPHPEWHFLFLFQFLNDFRNVPGLGKLEWLPVALLPPIILGFLVLAPWIDRGPERRLGKRPLMVGAIALGLLFWLGFTARGYSQLKPNATPENSLYGRFTAGGERSLNPAQVEAGRKAFAACGGCHAAYSDYQGRTAPELTSYGTKNFPLSPIEGHPEVGRLSYYDRFVKFVRGEIRPPQDRDQMPKYTPEMLPQEQLDAIGAYLSQDAEAVKTLSHSDTRKE